MQDTSTPPFQVQLGKEWHVEFDERVAAHTKQA